MSETHIPNLEGLPPFPGFNLTVKTVSHRRFPPEGPETYEPVYIKAEIVTNAAVSDEQNLTYLSGDILNMLSWVPGFYENGHTIIKPSEGMLRIKFLTQMSIDEWVDFHHNEDEFGLWLTDQLLPTWVAFCIRNNDPEKLLGHDILYLADVLNLVLHGTAYSDALKQVERNPGWNE